MRNDWRARNHPAWWAFLVHRISGLALALFLPLHFLTPKMDKPVVPVMFNTLAAPQPSARRRRSSARTAN